MKSKARRGGEPGRTSVGRRSRGRSAAVATAMCLHAAGFASAAQWNYTGVDAGAWNTASNWTLNGGATHQVPVNGDDAVLGLALGVSSVTFNATYSGVGLNSLTLDSPGHLSIALNQSGASAMIAASEYIGTTVSANSYNQSAGTNTVNTLYLGFNSGGFGNYNLSNTGSLAAGTEFIGFAGTGGGIFSQAGGTNTVTSSLVVGHSGTNPNNAYNLTGGSIILSPGAAFLVGNAGKGTFTQSGGSVSLSGNFNGLTIGTAATSTGSLYTLSGSGQLSGAGRISVGASGSGTLTQTGGSLSVGSAGNYTGTIAVGDNVNSNGTFNLSATTGAGTVTADTLYVGNAGAGILNQSGGTATINSALTVGNSAGSSGNYSLSNGTLIAASENIGLNNAVGNSAVLLQTGGTHSVTTGLVIGSAVNSTGNFQINSGNLTVGTNSSIGYVDVGLGGSGTFTQNGGTVSLGSSTGTVSSLIIGVLPGSNGNYSMNGGSLSIGSGSGALNVAAAGTGNFTQTGGSVIVNGPTGAVSIANIGGNGTYNLNGGSLSTAAMYVGLGGAGQFNHSSGSVTVGTLHIGESTGPGSSYTLSGPLTNTLTVNSFEAIGFGTTGTFTQTGGTHILNTDIQIGVQPGVTGTYQLNGGALNSIANIGVGQSGTGFFNQSNGSASFANGFYVGSGSGSSGTLNLSGGTLSAGTLYAGHNGTGAVNITGGILTVATLYDSYNNAGTVNLSGGTLTISSAGNVGQSAAGNFTLSGTGVLNAPNSPNTFNAFYIAGNSTFTQSGGTANGYFFNSGTFNFSGGTFNGSLENRATGTASFTNIVFLGGSLANHGILNIPGGLVGAAAGQTFSNDGTINLSLSGGILSYGPIINNGSILGTGSITGNAGFANNLVVTQGAGPLYFNVTGGSGAINNGTFTLATGRVLNLYSPITNNGAFVVNGALIAAFGGTLSNSAGGTVSGPGTILSGFTNGGTVLPGTGTLNISPAWTNAGVVELSGLTSALIGGAITNSGTIQGFGTVGSPVTNSTGTIEAIGGTLVLGGTLANAAGGTMTASSGDKILATGGLAANAGLISLVAGIFDNGGHALNNTGQISGYGTFRTGGGGLDNNGSITFTGGLTTVNGNVTNESGKTIKVSYNPAIFTGNVTNNAGGIIKTTSTTATFAGTFTNNGVYNSDPSTNYFANMLVGSTGALIGGAGDNFVVSGNLTSASSNPAWNTAGAALRFNGSGSHTLDISAQTAPLAFNSLTVDAGNTLNIVGGRVDVQSLNLQGSASLQSGLITTHALNFAPGSTLDLTSNKMVLDFTGADPYFTYAQLIKNGTIFTSAVPAVGDPALALVDNGMLHITDWHGQTISDGTNFNQLLFAYTYAGDANLNGVVDQSDYANVVAHMGKTHVTWFDGDLNGDGVVSLEDLSIVTQHLGDGTGGGFGSPLAAVFGPATAVPEPTALGMLAVSVLGMLRRRKTVG